MQVNERKRKQLIFTPLQGKILYYIFGSGTGDFLPYNSYQLAKMIYFQGKSVSKKVIYSFRDKIRNALISIQGKIEKAFKLPEGEYQLLCSWEPQYKKLETIVPERSIEKMKEILDSLEKPLGRPGTRKRKRAGKEKRVLALTKKRTARRRLKRRRGRHQLPSWTKKISRDLLSASIRKLPESEQIIAKWYFGFEKSELSGKEMAKELRISLYYLCYLRAKIKAKLEYDLFGTVPPQKENSPYGKLPVRYQESKIEKRMSKQRILKCRESPLWNLLSPKQQKALSLYYGLDLEYDVTRLAKEVEEITGIKHKNVRAIVKQAKALLKGADSTLKFHGVKPKVRKPRKSRRSTRPRELKKQRVPKIRDISENPLLASISKLPGSEQIIAKRYFGFGKTESSPEKTAKESGIDVRRLEYLLVRISRKLAQDLFGKKKIKRCPVKRQISKLKETPPWGLLFLREQIVMGLYYGLDLESDTTRSAKEVGEMMGMSGQSVNQLIHQAKTKIKELDPEFQFKRKPELKRKIIIRNEICDIWRRNEEVDSISQKATFVHVMVFPALKRLQQLVNRCPDLRMIRVFPSYGHLLNSKPYLKFAKRYRIKLISGQYQHQSRSKPNLKADVRFEYYQRFLLDPTFTVKRKWEELKKLGFPGVEIVERYLCLKGEKRIDITTLARERGINLNQIKLTINGIFRYLNLGYRTSEQAIERARRMERTWVPRLKNNLERELGEKSERAKYSKHGEIPNGLDRRNWKTFANLKEIWIENPEKWRELQEKDFRVYQILIRRYNLNEKEPEALSLARVGKEFGVRKQRIEKLEKRGVEFLKS